MLVFVGSTVIATERPPHLAWLDGELVLVALRFGWNSLTELGEMAKAGITGLVAVAATIALDAASTTCTPRTHARLNAWERSFMPLPPSSPARLRSAAEPQSMPGSAASQRGSSGAHARIRSGDVSLPT